MEDNITHCYNVDNHIVSRDRRELTRVESSSTGVTSALYNCTNTVQGTGDSESSWSVHHQPLNWEHHLSQNDCYDPECENQFVSKTR